MARARLAKARHRLGRQVARIAAGACAAIAFASNPAAVAAGGTPVLAVGDIGQCGSPGPAWTAELAKRLPGTILALGDLAYPDGSEADFRRCFDPHWGELLSRLRPAPGNHDVRTAGLAPYFTRFPHAGTPARPYYSWDEGGWHFVALDSNRDLDASGEQARWLASDLDTSRARCVAAFWHHPRASSGRHGTDPRTQALWEILVRKGVTLLVTAHDHHYERFLSMDEKGQIDPEGLTQFVVGTGGARLYEIRAVHPASAVRIAGRHGLLALTLGAEGYAWTFLRAPDGAVLDRGEAPCRVRAQGRPGVGARP